MALNKINEFIKANGIKPSDSKYHTWRDIKDEKDVPIGKVRILVVKSKPTEAHVELTCPKCNKESYHKLPWNDFKSETGRKSPFVVQCSCGNKQQIRKMQDEVKKKKKSGDE